MSYRAGDPRLSYRRQDAHTDARDHLDYPAYQRPFGQEESSRNVLNRNTKYHGVDSDYRSRLTKDRHSSKDQEIQDYELAVGSNQQSTRFPFVSQSEMRKQSGEEPMYRLNAAKNMSIEDEDMFLYGSETSSSVYLKDYMHGQKEPPKKSDDDGTPGIPEPADVEMQDYDPTIENILKSIGFNIDLSQVATEPTSNDTTVERKRVSAMPTSEPSVMVSEALVTSTVRAGFSKKIDSILPPQHTYEERARRYREEQTRLYAETNTSNDLVKAVPQLTPPTSGRSSLELLQSSYDYDAVVKEFAKEIENKEVQREMRAGSERETVSIETVVDPAATNKSKRTLYEDFSDSDDNLSDSGKPLRSVMKKVVDHFEAESQCPAMPDPRFRDEMEGKSKLGSRKETRTNAAEQSHCSTNVDRILSAEKTSKNVRGLETTETISRQVKVIPSTAVSETSSGRNSSVRYVVGSKWDSPKRDEKLDVETGTKNTVDPKIMEKRQAKIQSLNTELDKLKQEQKEMMRRKQRGRYGHKDPELLENSRHQAKISVEIDRLTRCTDKEFAELEDKLARKSPSTEQKLTVTGRRKIDGGAVTPEKNSTKSENRSDSRHKDRPKLPKMVVHYDYFDDGGHWCQSCNSIFTTIDNLCQHLHSSKHHEKMDSNHRPWTPKDAATKKGFKGVPVPIKGVEFLMPSQAFYCSLCSVFAGDAECAHDHLKSNEHNENYQRFLENDTTYEHHYNLDKEAAMSLISKKELENKREVEGQKFGCTGKRPLSTRSFNQNTKRTKLSEFSEKSPIKDYSDVQDAKSETAPTDSKMSSALSDKSQSDNQGGKAKDPASKAPAAVPSKTAVPLKKPAFIGKLPCLKGAKNRSSVSEFAKTNGIDVKEPKESPGTKQVLSNVVEMSQAQEIRESENVVKSSMLCKSEDDLTATNKSYTVPVDVLPEIDDSISSAIGQRLAAIKNSESGIECHHGGNGNQEETTATESEKLDPSCETEVMSLGDFEIFDECDAE